MRENIINASKPWESPPLSHPSVRSPVFTLAHSRGTGRSCCAPLAASQSSFELFYNFCFPFFLIEPALEMPRATRDAKAQTVILSETSFFL